MLNIHDNIKERLEYFKSIYKIPHIIFHGPSGGGKRTILNDFIYSIYNNNRKIINERYNLAHKWASSKQPHSFCLQVYSAGPQVVPQDTSLLKASCVHIDKHRSLADIKVDIYEDALTESRRALINEAPGRSNWAIKADQSHIWPGENIFHRVVYTQGE